MHRDDDGLGAAHSLWAKTDRQSDDWLSLPQHLRDSADVAGFIWDNQLSRRVRSIIGAGDGSSGRVRYRFTAGVHDVGKCTPAFEIQGPTALLEICRDAGFDLDPRVAHDRHQLPHSIASHVILATWLVNRHGWPKDRASEFAIVVGGHHGVYPTASQLVTASSATALLGTGLWSSTQFQLLDDAAERTGAIDYLDAWANQGLSTSQQVLLSGAVIVADWIASNADLFPYDLSTGHLDERTASAWNLLGLPPAWRAVPPTDNADALLRERFEVSGGRARPVQSAVLEIAATLPDPGLFIIEAPMGSGKTEAALMLAEHLAATTHSGGVFFALPSMATSDAIFSRVLAWVSRLPGHGDNVSIRLAHGRSELNDEYRGIASRGYFRGIGDPADEPADNVNALVHSWFNGRKKATLADFVVGTIDQVIMAALKTRHLVLRHLGLAGKVVIIDEVHAADSYMSVYLDRTLEWLGAHHVPVILLSATLPGERRKAMVEAYDIGRGTYRRPRPVASRPGPPPPAPSSPYDHLAEERAYPLIIATTPGEPLIHHVEDQSRGTTLTVRPLDDSLPSLVNLLSESLVDGGCAVVIRNTVRRAQECFEALVEQFGDDVTLTHSRFIATDRLARDSELVRRFGPPGGSTARPKRHIVVATQVVEQSLDIDFDLMVTDLAPVDLLLQRSGRLHRHERGDRPDRLRVPQMYITAVDWDAVVPSFDSGSSFVYGDDALLRSLAVLKVSTRPTLSIPVDIPDLVQSAYSKDFIPPTEWAEVAKEADRKATELKVAREAKAGAFLLGPPSAQELLGWTQGPVNDKKARAAVRDSQESLDAIVVKRTEDGVVHRWGADDDDAGIPTEFPPDDEEARQISACTVALPPALTGLWQIDKTIEAMEATCYPGWQASRWLKEQLVLELDENCQCRVSDFLISYDNEIGLTVVRLGDEK